MKKYLPLVALVAIIVIAYLLRAVIVGIGFGALATIVYFSLTGSTLNWTFKKK